MRSMDGCPHNENIQIKIGGYIRHLDYTHKSQKEYQQNYGVFCGFLEDSNSPSIAKDIKDSVSHPSSS